MLINKEIVKELFIEFLIHTLRVNTYYMPDSHRDTLVPETGCWCIGSIAVCESAGHPFNSVATLKRNCLTFLGEYVILGENGGEK